MPFSSYAFDIDGVIAESGKVNLALQPLIETLSKDYIIILITERSETSRAETCKWLKTKSIKYDHLYMRPQDHVGDGFKLRVLRRATDAGFYIHGYFDDDPGIAQETRQAGFPTVCVRPKPAADPGENLGW